MKLVKPSIEFLNMTEHPLEVIERAGRTCYKSEAKVGIRICPECKGIGKNPPPYERTTYCKKCNGKGEAHSSIFFVQKLLDRGHLAMIEHAWASYRVICDRGVTHEIVRHRLFSYAQESTRYCNYKGGVTFIIPPWLDLKEGDYFGEKYSTNSIGIWLDSLYKAERAYIDLLAKRSAVDTTNWTPQQARSVLPNALKTEIVITGNLREWLHFFKLRTAKAAHPQMQEIANMLLADICKRVDVIFEDIDE